MARVSTSIGALMSQINGLKYERDTAVTLLKRALSDYGWEHDAREFLHAIGRITINELPREEREEYEKLRGDK